MTGGADRVRPVIDPDTEPFWQACAEGRLVMPRCASCGSFRWPPRQYCPRCHERGAVWTTLPGGATVASYVVVHQAFDPAFAAEVPYVVAWLVLDGTEPDLRIVGNVVNVDPESMCGGMRVHVTFNPVDEVVTLPVFRPLVTAIDEEGGR